MGGIKTVGLAIECDRCGKTVPVNDDVEAEFYKNFAKRENRDDIMFVSVMVKPGQDDPVEIDFEYLCPKCVDAVNNYMSKIDPRLAPQKKEESPPKTDNGKSKPKTTTTEAKKPEEAAPPPPPAEEATAPPPAEEATPPPAEPGASYDDSALFD